MIENNEIRRSESVFLMRIKDVCKAIGISRSMIYQWINPKSKYHRSEFPLPVQIGKRCIGWKTGEIQEFIDNLKSA